MPSWAKAQVMGTKPIQFMYTARVGIEGVGGKQLMFVPMFDTRNACDSLALGTGAGYKNFTLTTQQQWPNMIGDGPQAMFTWAVNSGIDSAAEAEFERRYLWSPRKNMWEITNQETFPNQLKIYWCKPRRDLDFDTGDYNADGLNFMQGQSLNEIILRMFTRDDITTWSVNQLKNLPIPFTPFQSHTWCQYFKVVKVSKFKLDAGQCAVIKHTNKGWKAVNDMEFGDIEYTATRNMLFPFISAIGCPVFDSADIKKVDTGKVRLNIVYARKFSWYVMNNNTQQRTIVDVPAPAGAVVNARYVSKPVAGTVQAV